MNFEYPLPCAGEVARASFVYGILKVEVDVEGCDSSCLQTVANRIPLPLKAMAWSRLESMESKHARRVYIYTRTRDFAMT